MSRLIHELARFITQPEQACFWLVPNLRYRLMFHFYGTQYYFCPCIESIPSFHTTSILDRRISLCHVSLTNPLLQPPPNLTQLCRTHAGTNISFKLTAYSNRYFLPLALLLIKRKDNKIGGSFLLFPDVSTAASMSLT